MKGFEKPENNPAVPDPGRRSFLGLLVAGGALLCGGLDEAIGQDGDAPPLALP